MRETLAEGELMNASDCQLISLSSDAIVRVGVGVSALLCASVRENGTVLA